MKAGYSAELSLAGAPAIWRGELLLLLRIRARILGLCLRLSLSLSIPPLRCLSLAITGFHSIPLAMAALLPPSLYPPHPMLSLSLSPSLSSIWFFSIYLYIHAAQNIIK